LVDIVGTQREKYRKEKYSAFAWGVIVDVVSTAHQFRGPAQEKYENIFPVPTRDQHINRR